MLVVFPLGLLAGAVGFDGELVDRLGIGVSPLAHPDAPSSLSQPAAVPPGGAGD
jgi:hypothetical protein